MILFKEPRMEQELERADARLASIVTDLDELWPMDMVITCVERDAKSRVVSAASGPSGTSPHEARPCRAVDIRTRNVSQVYVQHAAAQINREWTYDPARPQKKVALVEPDHLHIQVHPNTVRRPKAPEVA